MLKEKYRLGRSHWRTFQEGLEKEWVLTNGIGGVANKTVIGASHRNHSGYLTVSLNPPADRWLVLSNVHESFVVGEKEYDLAAQEYIGWYREGQKYLNHFELDGVPTYTYQVNDIMMKKTIALEYGKNTVVICYEVENGMDEAVLHMTPLFNCKPYGEAMERANLNFDCKQEGQVLRLVPQNTEITLEKAIGVTEGTKVSSQMEISFYASEGEYFDRRQKPVSMATPNYLIEENEVYRIDNRNGFLGVDNHATPYDVCVALKPFAHKKFYLKCTVEPLDDKDGFAIVRECKERILKLMDAVDKKDTFARRLAWAADAFVVERKVAPPEKKQNILKEWAKEKVDGKTKTVRMKTILAGYPWFLDWGRDTMIALQGLTLPTKRFQDCREILEAFSWFVKEGMLPNVFPGCSSDEPMYNTIDAALWYFYSVYKYLQYTGKKEDYDFVKEEIYPQLISIINYYKNGTRFGIHMDSDGLIQGGSDLDQLTWMDVRVGDWVVTPRHGKAVEINALWYQALRIMAELSEKFAEDKTEYQELSEKVKASFGKKFWNSEKQCLYDCITVLENGQELPDDKIRPNQIFAVSLPFSMLEEEKELKIVQTVYKYLYTPYGIRSLSYDDKEYKGIYLGKMIDRDAAYHMGTSWGYISGAFISAYCKVYKHSKKAVLRAKEMCEYFEEHMQDGCLNGIAEVFDGDFTCTGRGCYTQAWSVGEVLRAYMEDVYPYLD